jgi:threonyl-tRNA synthetase
MERFCGLLIEHFAGNFPTWLAPEQIRILPMNDELVDAAKAIESQLSSVKIRCSVDEVADKLGAKIRKAEIAKVPHMIILGKKEAEAGKISVRSRANKELENISNTEDFISSLIEIIETKRLPDNQQN